MVKRTGSGSDELRKLADKLAAGSPRLIRETSVADIQKLVHELNVHQVELEMQNEELRQLQLELQEARDKYQALYKFMPTGYCTLERNFVIVEANPALGEMVGMDEHKLCGRKLTNFIAPDSQESFYFYKRKMGTNDGKSTCELKLLRADKTSFYVHMMSNVILEQDEHTRRYHVSITDISERKQTEEELQLRAQLLDSASDMIMLHAHNPDQPLMYVNEMMCQSLGYSREELLAMNMRRFVVPEIQSQFPSRHQILDDKGINHFESVWVRKDGSMLPVEVNARLVEIGGRRLVLASARDITERRKLETEQRELEQIAHITSRLASVGELAAGIAHEINNPLTGVIGYAELLQQEDLPEHVQKDLKTINDGAQRVASIVNRLLTFARQTKPMRGYVNINELILNTLDLREYHLRTDNIEVVTEFDPNLPITVADGGQLQQVFLNLIANAEFEMKRSHDKGRLLIKTEKMNNNILIAFKDDGPGISKENMEKLFSPFFTTKEVGSGTGLGLSICYGIVVEHGGRIWAKSKMGEGAAFFVELPVVIEPTQFKMDETEDKKPVETKVAKILVIDDEDIVRRFLTRVLIDEGHYVDVADNGEEALKKIKDERYNLILLDIKMPGMSGTELYQKIKRIAKSLANRVVFITGDIMGDDTKNFLDKTNAFCITKPFDVGQLKKELKRFL